MNSKKHDLTISLLSSGRGDTIERCLSSLAPFKEQLDTEIIVVDTDPDHNEDVMSILKKYADQIIPFEWCNDFAAARNVGVEAADGKWFLFVDDDEWFIDAQPLIDFIQSDEAEKWNRVSYRVRNYANHEFTAYGDSLGSRLFRMLSNTHFEGKVHEYMVPIKGKEKVVEAIAGHTGYIYDSEEEKEAHGQRNLTLLKEMMEKEPTQIRWILQLMAEYGNFHNHKEEIRLANKGYDLLKKRSKLDYQSSCLRGLFAANILQIYRKENKFEKCYSEYKRFLVDKMPFGKVSKAYMEFEAGQVTYHLGYTKKAKKCFESYLKAYRKLHDAPIEVAEDYIYFLMHTWERPKYDFAIVFLLKIDLEDGDWKSYEEYFHEILWDDPVGVIPLDYAGNILTAALANEYNDNMSDMLKTFWQSSHFKKLIQKALRSMAKVKDRSYWNLVRGLAEADMDKGIPIDVKIIWDDHNGIRERMPEYFSVMFRAVNPLYVDIDLLKIGMRRGAVLDDRIREIPFPRWQHCVDEFLKEKDVDEIKEMQSIMDDIYLGMPDEYYAYFDTNARDRITAAESGFVISWDK